MKATAGTWIQKDSLDVIFKVCKYILVKNRFACSSLSSLFCAMDRYIVCDIDPGH